MFGFAQIILAVYYTLADIVLLGQCFYYRGFTLRDCASAPKKQTDDTEDPHESTGLLQSDDVGRDYSSGLEHSQSDITYTERSTSTLAGGGSDAESSALVPKKKSPAVNRDNTNSQRALLSAVYNVLAILVVCGAGMVGWWLSYRTGSQPSSDGDAPEQSQEEI